MDSSGERYSEMQNLKLCRIFCNAVFAMMFCWQCPATNAQALPDVPKKYQHCFSQYVDHRSLLEKSLNLIGMSNDDVGRSFAVIAGVSHYPRLPAVDRDLRPAEVDKEKLISYLKNEELFDEIVVLWDEDMTSENLSYFLRDYFPRRLKGYPKSRFLFAYSGHGFLDGDQGYLLTSGATNFGDKKSSVNLQRLRNDIDEDVRSGYQVLVLLNSCYGGAFLNRTAFGGTYIPKHPGAHAITSGASNEKAWSDSRFGPGSVFFEKVLAGLGGAADRVPSGGDGIITTSELYAYLRQEVEVSTDQRQNPQLGDLSGTQSEGEFFFLNRERQARAKLVQPWNPVTEVPFGRSELRPGVQAANPALAPGTSQLRTLSGVVN
jgi:caspase domain-containing protein